MLRAYEGYTEEGKIFPIGFPTGLVGRHKVIITILDEPTGEQKKKKESVKDTETAQRLAALDEFFKGIESCDEEVPEFERLKFREVDI